MPVTRHLPHRSQACGTTALGSCLRSNAETLFRCFSYSAQSDRRCFLPLCAGRGRLNTVPLGRRPFLHQLRRWLAAYLWLCTFVRSLHRYYASVRLPRRVHIGCLAFGLPRPGPTVDSSRSPLGSPGFRAKSLRTCAGSLTPRVRFAARDSATYRVAFPTKSQGRQPELGDFGAQ